MYHCDDCGREGTPRMLCGRVLVCYCGSLELRWLPSPASLASPPSPPSRVELLESTPTKTTIRAVFKPPTRFDRFINDALTLAGLLCPVCERQAGDPECHCEGLQPPGSTTSRR